MLFYFAGYGNWKHDPRSTFFVLSNVCTIFMQYRRITNDRVVERSR